MITIPRNLLPGHLFLTFCVAACGAPPKPEPKVIPPPVSSTQSASAVRPEPALVLDGYERLDRSVVPLRYRLELTLDPARESFTGKAEIEVKLSAASSLIRLHAEGLMIAAAHALVGGQRIPATTIAGVHGGIGVRPARPLPAGLATLIFTYQAPMVAAAEAVHRVTVEKDSYIFTQFEPLFARRAFPCFDQPEFKTPFVVVLRVPRGSVALSNEPEKARSEDGRWQVVTFAESKPLPTYLVAFAVGPFDVLPIEHSGKLPLRIVTPRGKGKLTSYVRRYTPKILQALEDYFGSPYPYAKLDLIAVPNKQGAMENVGLVTFGERWLLIEEKASSPQDRLQGLGVITHELAHQWFGNWVTLAWWDDTWLNEAFASWIPGRILQSIEPAFEADLHAGQNGRRVMESDALAGARAIRQPIANGGDIINAFDDITYIKGGAVIRMIEAWTGEKPFQQAIRGYLSHHAHGVATNRELLVELDRITGKPVSRALATFLDQPGTPLVEMKPRCDASGVQLTLTQSRYAYPGSKAPPGKPWNVPVCLRYGMGKKTGRECFLLDTQQKTVALSAPACPDWIYPNDGEAGYYRWKLPEKDTVALIQKHLGKLVPAERIALAFHLKSLLKINALSAPIYLDALFGLAQDKHPLQIKALLDGLGFVYRFIEDEKVKKGFAAYVKKILSSHLARFGEAPRSGESLEIALLRPALLRAIAELGQDAVLGRKARAYAEQYLKKPQGMDASVAEAWLGIAVQAGDRKLWERLKESLKGATTPATRNPLVFAFGCALDPALYKASLNLVLDGTLQTPEFFALHSCSSLRQDVEKARWQWISEHYAFLVQALGHLMSYLPMFASSLCRAEDHKEVETYFAALKHQVPGTQRMLTQSLEAIDLCARLREKLARPFAEYFLRK